MKLRVYSRKIFKLWFKLSLDYKKIELGLYYGIGIE